MGSGITSYILYNFASNVDPCLAGSATVDESSEIYLKVKTRT